MSEDIRYISRGSSRKNPFYNHIDLPIGSLYDIDLVTGVPMPNRKFSLEKNPSPNKYPFKWSHALGVKLWTDYLKGTYKHRYPNYGIQGFDKELLRFFELLNFWDDLIPEGNKAFTREEIIKGVFLQGPEYNLYLAKQRKYAVLATISETIPSWLVHEDFGYLQKDPDEIFDAQCSIRWELPTEGEWKFSLEKPSDIDPDLEVDFRNKLKEFLLKYGREPLKQDVLDDLRYLRDTKVYTEMDLKSKTDNIRAFEKFKGIYKPYIWGKLTPVFKNAAEVREAVVLDLNSLHLLSDAGMHIGWICQDFPGFEQYTAMERGMDLYDNQKKRRYFMVDYSKCGWTTNRNIIKIALDQFYLMTQLEVFAILRDAYDSCYLYVEEDETEYHTKNGTLLGMLTELITVISVITFYMAKDEDILPKSCKGWFNNDDTLIYGHPQNLKEDHLIPYLEFCSKVGFKIHELKPTVSLIGHWAEVLPKNSPIQPERRLRQYSRLIDIYDSCNITEAKVRFSDSYMKYWGLSKEDNEKAFHFLVSFFGYEFQPKEIYLPFEAGGWKKNIQKGLNTFWYDIDDLPMEYKRVSLVSPGEFFPPMKKKIKLSTLSKIFDSFKGNKEKFLNWNSSIDSRIKSIEGKLFLHRRKLYCDPNWFARQRYYKRFYELRQKAFKSKTKLLDIDFEILLNSKDWKNYMIPEWAVRTTPPRYEFPQVEVPRNEDLTRYILYHLVGIPTRKVKGLPSSLLNLWFAPYKKLASEPFYTATIMRNLDKLSRFGEKSIEDGFNRFGNDWVLLTNSDKDLEILEPYTIGKGEYFNSLDGLIIKHNTDETGMFSRDQWFQENNIDPDVWDEFINRVNNSFEDYLGPERFTSKEPIVEVKPKIEEKLPEDISGELEYLRATAIAVSNRLGLLMPPEFRNEGGGDDTYNLYEDYGYEDPDVGNVYDMEDEGYDSGGGALFDDEEDDY